MLCATARWPGGQSANLASGSACCSQHASPSFEGEFARPTASHTHPRPPWRSCAGQASRAGRPRGPSSAARGRNRSCFQASCSSNSAHASHKLRCPCTPPKPPQAEMHARLGANCTKGPRRAGTGTATPIRDLAAAPCRRCGGRPRQGSCAKGRRQPTSANWARPGRNASRPTSGCASNITGGVTRIPPDSGRSPRSNRSC
mmetsp:Transcript_50685/g.163918  ORF Transcript_50685/g.163918 Transcript_50685/m.163918 type:complete len:201 (+) Transcript_50685:804-1406(+)